VSAGGRRLELRREAPILLPATLALCVVLALVTLFAYRTAVDRLGAERAAEALALAQRLAADAARQRPLRLDELRRALPPGAGLAILGPDGRRRGAAGAIGDEELPRALLAEAQRGAAVAFGPERAGFPAVVACAPLAADGEALLVRVDLPAPTLAAERRALAVLTPLVIGLSFAAILLVVLFLRALLRAEARARLTDGLAQLGELSAGVAHELRNGVAAISGWVALAKREPLGAAADCLEEIDRECRQLARVVGDFLTFARPGTRRLGRVDLAAVLRRAAQAPEGGAAVELRLPPGEAAMTGDEQLLERAFRNLVANALEATRAAGSAAPVEITLAARAGGWQVDVADRGPGIPASVRGRLFEPFATGRAEGVGLGLALARRILLLHAGTIAASDRDGGGTRFRVELPADISDTESS
jgi:signal transduction histidine kinase